MRAAIYIRVSTSEQAAEGYSLAAQRKSLMQWCNGRAYDVTGVYADEGISAKRRDQREGHQASTGNAAAAIRCAGRRNRRCVRLGA